MENRWGPTLADVGLRIRGARESRRLTLEEFGEEIRISKGRMSEIENGLKELQYSTLVKLASRLGVHVSDLLGDATRWRRPLGSPRMKPGPRISQRNHAGKGRNQAMGAR